jgi:hypothetical protein
LLQANAGIGHNCFRRLKTSRHHKVRIVTKRNCKLIHTAISSEFQPFIATPTGSILKLTRICPNAMPQQYSRLPLLIQTRKKSSINHSTPVQRRLHSWHITNTSVSTRALIRLLDTWQRCRSRMHICGYTSRIVNK